MSGPKILLVVAVLLALLVWGALGGDDGIDVRRGREETDAAFARIEVTLEALEPDFQWFATRGVRMQMKEQRESVLAALTDLRVRRRDLLEDPELGPRERMVVLDDLVVECDEVLVAAIDLRRKLAARRAFIEEATPLLGEARALRDDLSGRAVEDAALRTRISNLAGRFAELEVLVQRADTHLGVDLDQGRTLAATATSELGRLIDEQRAALRELDG